MDDEDVQDLNGKPRLRYDREELLSYQHCDGALLRPNALALEFFREQRDGDQLWSPEAWASARTQSETPDAGGTGNGSGNQSRERGTSIVLGPGASRRNWSSGCGTQQGATRNRELSSSETSAAQQDDSRPSATGAFRATDRDSLRFRDRDRDRDRDRERDRQDFTPSRGGRFGVSDTETTFGSGTRGAARGGRGSTAASSFSAASRGRMRLDQAGLRSNQLFDGLVGSRGKDASAGPVPDSSGDSDHPDRERGFDRDRERTFDRERPFDRDRDRFDRDRGGISSRGGFRRDREAPYNAALSGSGAVDTPTGRFGSGAGGMRRSIGSSGGGGRFDDEPEWLTGGPKDAFDCLELHGLPEDEERHKRGNDDDGEEIMEIGGDEDDDYDDEEPATVPAKPAMAATPTSNRPSAVSQPFSHAKFERAAKDSPTQPQQQPFSRKEEVQPSVTAKPEEKKDEKKAPQPNVLDVDMTKLAGSRLVKWVLPANDEPTSTVSSSIQITVVNQSSASSAATSSTSKPTVPSTPTTQPISSGAAKSNATAISLNDIFKMPSAGVKSGPQNQNQSPAAHAEAAAGMAQAPNGGKPTSAAPQMKTLQELEVALGIKNNDSATINQSNKLNALLASIGPNPNAQSNANPIAPSAAANRVGKPISVQALFSTGATAASASTPATGQPQPQKMPMPTGPNVSRANQPQVAGTQQPQLSDSVQRLFQAQSLAMAGGQSQQQQQAPWAGSNGGNGSGSRPETPTARTPIGSGGPAGGWPNPANVPMSMRAANPNMPASAQQQPASQAPAGSNSRNDQVANVITQLTSMVLGKFNSSQVGSQQREQAAAAFSANVVQAAVQMFVGQLLKSIDNPTVFFEQLERMRSNLPVVIRQFVASGIDPQLAEQFLSTIISVAPHAIALLGPQTQAQAQSQPSAPQQQQKPQQQQQQQQMNMALLSQQMGAANLGAGGNQQANANLMAALAAQQRAAQQQQQHQAFGHVGNPQFAGSQAQAAYPNAAQQQQMIEASLAKRAAMNVGSSGQMGPSMGMSNAYAQAMRTELDTAANYAAANVEKQRQPMALGGQQFVPTQVLRQMAAQPKARVDADDSQQPVMRPITKASSRDTIEAQSNGASASGLAMQQQVMFSRQQALLAAIQQANASQQMSKQ